MLGNLLQIGGLLVRLELQMEELHLKEQEVAEEIRNLTSHLEKMKKESMIRKLNKIMLQILIYLGRLMLKIMAEV